MWRWLDSFVLVERIDFIKQEKKDATKQHLPLASEKMNGQLINIYYTIGSTYTEPYQPSQISITEKIELWEKGSLWHGMNHANSKSLLN